jgi:hypothetical protein
LSVESTDQGGLCRNCGRCTIVGLSVEAQSIPVDKRVSSIEIMAPSWTGGRVAAALVKSPCEDS